MSHGKSATARQGATKTHVDVVSSQTAGFALPLEKAEDVALTHGALHVANDRPGGVIQELHADL